MKALLLLARRDASIGYDGAGDFHRDATAAITDAELKVKMRLRLCWRVHSHSTASSKAFAIKPSP